MSRYKRHPIITAERVRFQDWETFLVAFRDEFRRLRLTPPYADLGPRVALFRNHERMRLLERIVENRILDMNLGRSFDDKKARHRARRPDCPPDLRPDGGEGLPGDPEGAGGAPGEEHVGY